AGHVVGIAHRELRLPCSTLKFPPLFSAHAVGILELPFEQALPFVRGDDDGENHFVRAEVSGDSHLLADGEIRCAALDFEFRIHFSAYQSGMRCGTKKTKISLRGVAMSRERVRSAISG